MADQYDWLPADWKVEVRVRKNGKKDKLYIQSSTGVKLFSKPEVLSFLNNTGVNSPESQKTGKIDFEGYNKTKVNVSVVTESIIISTTKAEAEKNMSEELPPGWIKKVRVTMPGGRIRKDSYYRDPVNGYIFRSKKEVFRYIETREIKRRINRPRPKVKDRSNVKINDDKGSVGQILAGWEPNRQILHRNDKYSKLIEGVEDDKTIESTCTDDCGSLAEHIQNPCNQVVAAIKSLNPAEANVWKQDTSCSKERENLLISITKQGIIRSRDKKPLDLLPSCTSKRLACANDSTSNKNKSKEVKMDDPNAYLMMDPCIEFAVKTLRGEIPIEDPPSLEMLLCSSWGRDEDQPSLNKLLGWGRDPTIQFDLNETIPFGETGEGSKQQ